MYRERLDGFVLVSSDSDFTRLAQRLREGGFAVYGFGESKTPSERSEIGLPPLRDRSGKPDNGAIGRSQDWY